MIYGDRIRLRRPERSDIPTFTRWLNDPEVRRGISVTLPMSLANEEQWFEKMLKNTPEEQTFSIEIPQGENWLIIGNCSLFDIDWRSRCAEVGILIGEKQFWNQGYGTECMRLMLKVGFETYNLNRIFLHVKETNPGAIRAYEKAGFQHEGCKRQADFQEGRYIDVLLMSVLHPEWQP
jgi:RimJ/RimL family protein N-acetyltransferase